MAQRSVSIVIEVAGADDAVQQVRRMRSALDDLGSGGRDSLSQVLRQSREVSQAMKEMEKTFPFRSRQKEMVGDLEEFFRRMVSGARTTGDVFKNIWKEVSDFFRGIVREMAAAATINLGGPLLGGPGLLSSLGFGSSLLGLGGSVGTLSRSAPTLAATLGLPPTVPLGDVLARVGGGSALSSPLLGLGGMAGLSLIGNRSRLASTLGGFFGGGLAGLATGFAFGGPIGAVIGGLVGLFTGGGGKDKEQDASIANQGFAQLRQIKEDYERFRRDFASTMDAMNRVWSQMESAFVRGESSRTQRPWFDIMLAQVRQIEDERNRRRQVLTGLPVPEFQEGGLVATTSALSRRGTLAIVHPGEFVMNRQTVERLGVGALEGLNRGAVAGGNTGGMQISLEPASAHTLGEMLKANPQALEEGLLVVLRKGGAASRALRG